MNNTKKKVKYLKKQRILNELDKMNLNFIGYLENIGKYHKIKSEKDKLCKFFNTEECDLLSYTFQPSCNGPDDEEEAEFVEYIMSIQDDLEYNEIIVNFISDPNDEYDYDENIIIRLYDKGFVFIETEDLDEYVFIFDIEFLYNFTKLEKTY